MTPEELREALERELDVIGPTPGPFTRILAETFPGAHKTIEKLAQRSGGWICEQHPERPWPHKGCAGPGMLKRVEVLDERGDVIGTTLDVWAAGQRVGDLNCS